MQRTTGELREGLLRAPDLSRFLADNEQSFVSIPFSKRLNALLERRGAVKAELAETAGISEVYLYQLLSGTRTPSRDRTLSLCLALRTGLARAEELLRASGAAGLYPRTRRDAVLIYCLENTLLPAEANERLAAAGEKPLF